MRHTISVTIASLFVASTLLAANPAATSPSLPPAKQKLEDCINLIASLADKVKTLKDARMAQLKASDAYKAAVTDRDEKYKELQDARATGTPQAKLDASSAYGKARSAVEKIEAKYGITPEEKAATEQLASEQKRLPALQQAADSEAKSLAQAIAARKAEEDAIKNAIEITDKMLDVTGERYVGKTVKITNGKFDEIGTLYVDDVPGVTIASNGLQYLVNTSERQKWVELGVKDRDGNWCRKIFALKDPWADKLIDVKHNTPIDIIGIVVKLDGIESYGIIMLNATLHPEKMPRESD